MFHTFGCNRVRKSTQWDPYKNKEFLKLSIWVYGTITFRGGCFGADSAPILSARNTRRARAAREKKVSTMNIDHVSMGADSRAD